MSTFALLLLATILVGVASQDPVKGRPCSHTSECCPEDCCLSPVERRGKRQAEGYCKPKGQVGGRCYVKNDQLQASDNDLLYADACPCLPSLHCQGTGLFEVPQGEQGVCTANAP